MVLPSVLTVLVSGSEICWMKSELEVLQRIENGVWRTIMLGTPGYAPVPTLQSEVGASVVVARDIKQKLSYQK